MAGRKTAGDAAEAVTTAAPRRRRRPTRAQIEKRAYYISQSERAGTPLENWLAAERELLAA